jgi:hypothetical protein
MKQPQDSLAVVLCKVASYTGVLQKTALVSQPRAARALDRLDTLNENKPTLGQVGRYAGIGGVGGAAISSLGNVVEHYKPPTTPGIKGHLLALGQAAVKAEKNPTVSSKVRLVAANTMKGALGGGAIPLLRSAADRHAEQKVLREYLVQQQGGSDA